MGPQTAPDSLRRLLANLYSEPGVSGACLQVAGVVLIHDLPYSDDRVATLAARIDHLVSSYDGVGRTVWQVCAGFDNFWLLILCRSNIRLSILLKPDSDPSLVAGRATRLLMEVEMPPVSYHQAPPVESAPPSAEPAQETSMSREEFTKLLGGLMGRVTGSAQAVKIIQRELNQEKTNGLLTAEDVRRIGLAILEYIPNRGKRSALSSEFLNALDS